MRINKRIILYIFYIIFNNIYCFISPLEAADKYASEMLAILNYQKSVAEGSVELINEAYNNNCIDFNKYNEGKRLYLLASSSFNALIKRIVLDIESGNDLDIYSYRNNIDEAKRKSNELTNLVESLYRGKDGEPGLQISQRFLDNFNTLSNQIEVVFNNIPPKLEDKNKLINEFNMQKWRPFDIIVKR